LSIGPSIGQSIENFPSVTRLSRRFCGFVSTRLCKIEKCNDMLVVPLVYIVSPAEIQWFVTSAPDRIALPMRRFQFIAARL
jgi:hypothetical protein